MRLRTLCALALAGCALSACANTQGGWSCSADRGVPCQSIASLDQDATTPPVSREPPPTVAGSGALRWWTAKETPPGAFDTAPRREPDQLVRVLVAGWTDAAGDYHAPSEIFAVMRRGGWWAPPPAAPLAPAAGMPPPPATPAEAKLQ